MDRLVISVEELRRQLGIGRNMAYELVNRSDFPAVRIGKRIVVPAKELEAWLERQSTSAEA